ncbi:filamentous hemagglutinin N-terminal domain-containing protein [Enterobacteriaceae bacterium 4M9]|nr:filamentous hemagglutinin N-terminal domain-containing protein [Enterobacteriaceae bacterium 4M9]
MDNNNSANTVRFSQRLLSYLISALLAGQPLAPALAAAITPTGSTKMDQAANGVPVVNIATPNGAGVSHNQFKDYNVGKEGLILNNATGKLNQTQLGGLIQSNPNLKAGQEARGIINEVTGANRSQLQGYTEVAGKAANVMVANPYGITCNGCGFINTPNATLTTGKPQFDAAGNLLALDVSKGSIIVEGQGLDASASDALSIIARATEVNAAIHAKDLSVTVGANRVNADGSTQAIAGEGAAPAVAVDTGALGGMYANRIRLVSSEKGVGINLGNLNARQGDIRLDASGKITLNNSLASGNTTVNAQSVALNGDHKAGGNLAVTSSTDITQGKGTLNSDKNVTLNAGGALTLSNSLAAGNSTLKGQSVALSGTHRAGNTLNVSGQDIALNSAALTADSNLQLTADDKLAQSGGKLTAGQDIALNAKTLTQNAAAQADAARNIALTARDSATLAGKTTAAQQLALSADTLSNSGQLAAGGAATVKSTSLTNSGTLQGGAVAVNSTSVTNTGSLASGGTLDITAQNLTQQGSVGAKGKTTLSATQKFTHSGSTVSDDALTVNASTLTQDGTLSGAKGLNVTASTLTSGAKSVTHSDGAVTLNAQTATLNGETSAGTTLAVKGQTLTTQTGAQLQSGAGMTLEAAKTTLNGTQAAKGALTVTASDSLSHSGNSTGSTVNLKAGTLTNSGIVETPALTVNAKNITNSGTLYGKQTFSLFADQLANQAQGVLYSEASLALTTPVLSNAGTISAPLLAVDSQTVANSGLIQGRQTLSLLANSFDNQAQGVLYSAGDFTLNLPEWRNAGTVASDGQLTLSSTAMTNSGLLQGTKALNIQATRLDNLADGVLYSGARLALKTPTLTNAGEISAPLLGIESQTLTNSGQIQASQALSLLVNSLDNQAGGMVYSAADLALNLPELHNAGTIASDTQLALTGTRLTNSGLLQGGTGLTVSAESFTQSTAGRALTGGALDLTATTLTTDGALQGQSAQVQADNWQHSGSLLGTRGLTTTVNGTLVNKGDLLSQGDVNITTQTLDNQGSLLSDGDMQLTGNQLTNSGALQGNSLTLSQTRIDNTGTAIGLQALTLASRLDMAQPLLTLVNGGSLLTQGTLNITGGDIHNTGNWQGQQILLDAQSLTHDGTIQSADALTFTLSGNLSTGTGSKISANGTAALNALAMMNQGQWIAGNLTVKGATLDNRGDITGVNGLTVALTGDLAQTGEMLSAGRLTLNAANINQNGRIQGSETNITAGSLTNDGRIQGDSALTLSLNGKLTNNDTLLSQGTLTLSTPALLNYGVIQGAGATRLTATQKAQNDGKILSGGTLTLETPVFTNNSWLQATELLLNAATLNNSGTLLAQQNATLTGTQFTNSGTTQASTLTVNHQTLNNAGTLLGNNSLSVTARNVDQQANGKLFSGGDLLLNSTALTSLGQLVALGNLTLKLTNAFSAQNVIAAGKQLTIESGGDITNVSTVQGNGVTLTAGGKLINKGQITTGSAASSLSGSHIALTGDGTLQAGGDVTLTSRSDILLDGFTGAAGSLTLNATASIINTALLYAGNNLMLLADSIQNLRGDILAGNSLWMQKDAAGTANREVVNTSGTIETQNGDITIKTASLENKSDGLSNSIKEETFYDQLPSIDGETITIWGDEAWHPDFQILVGGGNQGPAPVLWVYPDESTSSIKYLVERKTETVNISGTSGRIASGRDLFINSSYLLNEASSILANRNLTMAGEILDNKSYQAKIIETYKTYQLTNYGFNSNWVPKPEDVYFKYTLSENETIETLGTIVRSVIQAGGTISASFNNNINNGDFSVLNGKIVNSVNEPTLNTLSNRSISSGLQAENLAGANNLTVDSPQWQDQLNGALQQISGGSPLDGNTSNGNVPGNVDTSMYPLPSGNNGYFVTSTDPDSPYLITVNPKLDGLGQLDESLFGDLYALLGIQPGQAPRETGSQYTDQNQFIGSAYFLDRLNLNPDYDYRFLGDAAFDTRYASNYILNQTGSRYINGVGSDLEQMRRLVDNAAVASQALGLKFGVALTATQIAALDSSIIWWEAAVVNGQTVMVPKVYLSPKDVTVHDDSVISGSDVLLTAGNITNNGGTLTAQNNLTANSQNSLSNLNAGLISAGNGLQLSALGDINNVSSTISGKTVQLESIGGSINNTTLTQRLGLYATSNRDGTVSMESTLTGNTASINAGDGLLMKAGQDINVTGANVSAGGSLAMVADGDINVSENQLTDSYSRSGLRGSANMSNAETSNQASHITAGGNLAMQAGNDLTLSASHVNAGGTAQLVAGNDLNLNSAATATNSSRGNSESHATGVDRTTVTAGDDLVMVAGRDLNSQAAGLAAEGNVGLQAGRDVNLMAEATSEGDSYQARKKVEINESVRQQGTEIASGGDTMIIAGRDVNTQAAQVTAQGDIGVAAGRDINLDTATESDYRYFEETKTKKGFLSKKTTHTIEEDSATREQGTLLSGDNVTLSAGNNLLVKGSAVVGDGDVSLSAGDKIDIVAATNTDSTYRLKETKKSGLMGTGGIGVTIGSAKSRSEMNEDGTTQSQSFSTVGSTGGNVSITAGGQAHIGGADLVANKDLSITGDSVVIEPGRDQRTRDESFEQKSSGLTVALSGVAGDQVNNAISAAKSAKQESDGRLAALQATKSALSGVQAGLGVQQASAEGDANNAVGVSLSLSSQKSKSQQHQESTMVSGSTLNAGNNLSVTATGQGNGANSGDIAIGGSQLKAGGDMSLNAANDIVLAGAANTQQTTGSNSSSGGGVGVSFGAGSGGAGLSVFANINSGKGSEKGNGTVWTETTLDSGGTVSLTSGRDTTLSGAQVSGNKVEADVGRDLTISSLQDSDSYDSKQSNFGAGGSFTFGSMTGSGYASISKDKMHSNYDSVVEQSGIYAGNGGFDVTVGSHTQLDGGVIASTATPDKNNLDTGTLGWSNIDNSAQYSVSHSGGSFGMGSGGGSLGSQIAGNALSNMAGGVLGNLNGSGSASGTTQAAVSDGSITIRDKENQQQDIATLSRDAENANDSISPIFDKEKEQKRLQGAQLVSQITGQMRDIVSTYGDIQALEAAKKNPDYAGKTIQEIRQTKEYQDTMKSFGIGSQAQMAVQAIAGVLGGLNADNLGQALSGGLNPLIAQAIKAGTEGNDTANMMAHAIWGAVAAQVSGGNAAAGAAGVFSSELAGRYILDNYYGGDASKLSEQQKQEISMLATLAGGLAGGLAGDSTASATTGAQAGKNAVDNNALAGCSPTMCKQGVDVIGGGGSSVGGGMTGGGAGVGLAAVIAEIFGDDKDSENAEPQPNVGANLTDDEKAEVGGAGSGTGTPPPPENDPKNQKEEKPSNIKMADDKYLKRNGIDAHKLKEEFLGDGKNSNYDIYINKDSGELWIFRKGGKGDGIATGEFIK